MNYSLSGKKCLKIKSQEIPANVQPQHKKKKKKRKKKQTENR